MKLSSRSFVLLLLFSTFVFGQQSARKQKIDELNQVTAQLKILKEERRQITDRQLELLKKIKSVSEQDATEAAKLGAQAVRLFPCCALENMVSEMDEITFSDSSFEIKHFSSYQITDFLIAEKDRTSREYPETITFSENALQFIEARDGNHGFILDLGKTEFEKIDEQTSEVAALAEYVPPTDENNIRKDFTAKGLTFGRSAPVTIGNTYILRAIKYSTVPVSLDGIFAVKIHRRDKDGSIILFIKAVKMFEPPKLKDPEREEYFRVYNLGLVAKLKEEFGARGFREIEIEVVDRVVVLKGSVPFGKVAEAVEIAKNITYGTKVKSELLEK